MNKTQQNKIKHIDDGEVKGEDIQPITGEQTIHSSQLANLATILDNLTDKIAQLQTNQLKLQKQTQRLEQQLTKQKKKDHHDILMQSNTITALNEVCLKVEKRTPLLVYEDKRTEGDSDHEPQWNSVISHPQTGFCGQGKGKNKRIAREKAARVLLATLYHNKQYRTAISETDWARDLLLEGIEPNPGPTSVRSTEVEVSPSDPKKHFEITDIEDGGYVYVTITQESATITTMVTVEVSFEDNTSIEGTVLISALIYASTPILIRDAGKVQGRVVLRSGVGKINVVITCGTDAEKDNPPILLDPRQLPLWTTEYGPPPPIPLANAIAKNRTLALSGDVEENPGPATTVDQIKIDPITGLRQFELFMPTGEFDEQVVDLNSYRSEPIEDRDTIISRDRESLSNELKDSLMLLAKGRSFTSKYFHTMAVCYSVPVENRYGLLSLDMDPEEVEDDETHEEVLSRIKVKHRMQNKPTQPGKKSEDDDIKAFKKQDKTKQADKIQIQTKARNISSVMNRIGANLKAKPDTVVYWLDTKNPTRKFVDLLAKHMFGTGWELKQQWNQIELLFYSYINVVPRDLVVMKMLEFHKHCDRYMPIFENMRADLEAANLHNKIMHAYNGNPLSTDFSDVSKAIGWYKMLEEGENSNHPIYTGYELQAMITNIVGDVNPNQSNVFSQDRLRGNVVKTDNTIVHNCVTPLPSTNLIPRAFITSWDPANEVKAVTTRLRVSEVNTAEYYVNPIQPTDLSEMISDAVKNNTTSNWRRDNTTLAGFSSFDVASVNTTLTPKGLSLESMLLKYDMLHSIVASVVNYNMVPASSRILFDPRAVAAPQDMVLNINDSEIFGENCGGLTAPVFPWGGDVGTIAFHLTIQSIPPQRRADAIFCPPGLLQSSIDVPLAIALFALGWADWPFGIYTCTNSLLSIGPDEDAVSIKMVPQQSITRIPGTHVLDIVLPRRWGESNPTTQEAANAQTISRATFGPVAVAGHAANELIPMNYTGGAYQTVPLTQYLVSWATAFDITSIKQYLGRLGAIVGVSKTLTAVHDMNVALTQMYPKMVLSDGTYTNVYCGDLFEHGGGIEELDTSFALDYCYNNHQEVTIAETDFPIEGQISADFRIFATDPLTWNKVVLGLSSAPNLISERLTQLPIWIGNPSCMFWDILTSIPQTIAWAHYFNTTGMTTQAWDGAYTSTLSQWMQEIARATFCTTQDSGSIIPAKFGPLVRTLYQCNFDRSVQYLESSVCETIVPITVFDRWLPGNKFANVIHNTTDSAEYVSGLCPVLLPDVWVQYPAKFTPKYAMSFPRPFSADSTQGFGAEFNLTVHRVVNNNRVSPYIKPTVAVYPVREGPFLTDEEMFNNRIWFTETNRVFASYSGEDLPGVIFPPPGYYPQGRAISLGPGENAPPQLANLSTLCVPAISYDSLRIMLYLNQAQAVIPIQACNKARRLERSAWLLGEVFAAPELQYVSEMVDPRFKIAEKKSGFRSEAGPKVVPARVEEVALQAVDPVSLPSVSSPLDTMPQPAPSASAN